MPATKFYTAEIEVDEAFAPWNMAELTDHIAELFERKGARLANYSVIVKGAPEFRIGLVMR